MQGRLSFAVATGKGENMLKLKCVGSGSNGNCYLLYNGEDVLILDCGLPIMEIKRGLRYNLMGIKGVCVTHAHLDHSQSVKDFRKMHVPVFAPYEQETKPQTRQYGQFKIAALPLMDKQMQHWQHTNGDGTECPCYAFLIEADGQQILYVTDTKLLVWNLQKVKLNRMLIGLNYIPEMLSQDDYKRYHVLTGHLGLETVKGIVKANQTADLMSVILCHMSAESSDKDKCISEVKKVAGNAIVDVAEGGKEWKLYGAHECPF